MQAWLLFFAWWLVACQDPRPALPSAAPTSRVRTIEAEPVGRRGVSASRGFICGGLGLPSLVIGARILMLDGLPVADAAELRRILASKADLERRLGAPTPSPIWGELVQPGRGVVEERTLLAAVREEGFTIVLHERERDSP